MIPHGALRIALRDRLVTAAGITAAMCAWLNANYKLSAVYVKEDFVPGPLRRITIGDTAHLEATGLLAVRLYANETLGEAALLTLVDAILARFDATWAVALSGSTYLYMDGNRLPYPQQILPSVGNLLVAPIVIPWLALTSNAVAA